MPTRREKRSEARGSSVTRKTRKLEEPVQWEERGPEGNGTRISYASVEGIIGKFERETGGRTTATCVQPKQFTERAWRTEGNASTRTT